MELGGEDEIEKMREGTCLLMLVPLIGASLSEPHINVKFMRLVCLSVRTFMTRKYTIVVICRVPVVVDSSVYGDFGELLCMSMFNKHVVTNNKNKQVLILNIERLLAWCGICCI